MKLKDWQPFSLLFVFFAVWLFVTEGGMVSAFILPSPIAVVRVFAAERGILFFHATQTMKEALYGLAVSLSVSFIASVAMDRYLYWRKAIYPLLVVSQAVPYITIAPMLVIWLGNGIAPRVVLVALTCFFPIAIGLYDGMRQINREYLDELRVLGGSYTAGLVCVKLPLAMPSFFSGMKIAVTYSFVGAVIAGWAGGTKGLGVYMTRVRQSYEYNKLFAAVLLIVIVSLVLMYLVKFLEKRMTRDVI